ncbi:tetratricopeptide repeat protein 17-like isoform X2 [Lineus longissimus]|uniref:tetratricopeptide repeat protein 17-like isoform X2 n=1 Tax=Lineus longissimus TaxID=88925 RepID=UPI002B4DE57E
MAVVLLCFCILLMFLGHLPPLQASTHWIVTEDGRIQHQLDSVLSMRRPYDLVALIKQEERAQVVEGLKHELITRKEVIDSNEDRDVGLEQRFYRSDIDCQAAGKALPEFDLYISTVQPLENKGIRPEDHIDLKSRPTSKLKQPTCSDKTKLDYSIHSFEHLEGVQQRRNLTGTPELGLKNALTFRDNIDDYGHLICEALDKNRTSWVLYNMAAFYWRIKGNPYQVIECLRRALHFSPRTHKDVALISLANILHRARFSNEAAIVVHAALDISKELNVNHFTLGNIYAVLGDYNKSIICFDNTLKIQPEFEAAAKRKHAVMCHQKLEAALEAQHRSLQKTLDELRDYQEKHEIFQMEQAKLQSEQAPSDMKLDQRLGYEQQRIRESSIGVGEHCRMMTKEGKKILKCTWGRRNIVHPEFDIVAFNEAEGQRREKYKKEAAQKRDELIQMITSPPPTTDYFKPVHPIKYSRQKPDTPKGNNMPWKSAEWPNQNECDIRFPAWNEFPTTYLPAENKGFEVRGLLSEALNLKPGDEHPLPWYPPVCLTHSKIEESKKSFDHLLSIKDRARAPSRLPDVSIKEHLIRLVDKTATGDPTEEEIGQRILSSLKKNVGPSWILYNLAGLYWRIIGNHYQGIECLRRALVFVPDNLRDVPLVNMANLLYKAGMVDDAIEVLEEALSVCDYEPSAQYLMGNLNAAKGNFSGAAYHYEKALEIEPESQDIIMLLKGMRCYFKFQKAQQSSTDEADQHPQTPRCQRKVQEDDTHQTESRIICKTENGKEICIYETRTRAKAKGQCPSSPSQMCPASQVKVEGCEGGNGETIRIVTPEGCAEELTSLQCQRVASSHVDNPYFTSEMFEDDFTSIPVKPIEPLPNDQVKPFDVTLIMENEFEVLHIPMDEATATDFKKLYRKYGFCKGDECQRIIFEYGGRKPHIKLSQSGDQISRHLLFSEDTEVPFGPTDCVLFADGVRTRGCETGALRKLKEKLYDFRIELLKLEARVRPPYPTYCDHPANQEPSASASDAKQEDCIPRPLKMKPRLYNYVLELPEILDADLPDTSVHVSDRLLLSWPSLDECQGNVLMNLKQFTSTWLSVSTKGVNIYKHIDFNSTKNYMKAEPFCNADFGGSARTLDHLRGVAEREQLNYSAEYGLKEVLQKLGREGATLEDVSARIAHALKKNSTSWVVANMAALYWRVRGKPKEAIDCLRLALNVGPLATKDVSLVSIANILHRAERLNDAIVVNNMALDVSPKIVVIHFTMANIYAAKGDLQKATLFYESTLGLQSHFEPAKIRLRSIQCHKVLSESQPYKTDRKNG